MASLSNNVPASCPGTDSDEAGRAAPCQGCPNQAVCSNMPQSSTPDPAIAKIQESLANVKNKFVVLSGKGGVGKSMVATHIALSLAKKESRNVSVLDIDICGPSVPTILGLEGEEIHQSADGWSQVYCSENLGVISIGFLLSNPDTAVVWRGPRKNGLIKQFLQDVDWGDVDYLIIDTPPGTSDEHLSLVQYLNAAEITGAIIVTTPQEVALMDVRKEINFCKKVGLPVIGVVENMSSFVCEKCSHCTDIFAPTSGGAEAMCRAMGVKLLGKVPLDAAVSRCCDVGKSFLSEHPDSPAAGAIDDIVTQLLSLSSD